MDQHGFGSLPHLEAPPRLDLFMNNSHTSHLSRPRPTEKKGSTRKTQLSHVERVLSAATQSIVGNTNVDTSAQLLSLAYVRLHWRPMVIAFLSNLTIVMEGYSMNLHSMLFIHTKFLEDFGHFSHTGAREISSSEQLGLMLAVQAGAILGLYMIGHICDRYGYRISFSLALLLVIAFVFVSIFANSIPVLCGGQFLLGIPFGMFQSLTIAYANEIAPSPLQAITTSNVNINWLLGQLMSSIVMVIQENRTDYWAWRIPFLIVLGFAFVLLFVILCTAPESPVWLIRKRDYGKAEQVLTTLCANYEDRYWYVEDRLQEIRYTIREEVRLTAESGFKQTFRGTDRRRTLITSGVWAIQALCGTALLGMSSYYYKNAGLDVHQSLLISLGQHCLGIFGTIASWILMAKFTRRPILLSGLTVACVLQMIIGSLGCISGVHKGVSWTVSILLICFSFVYNSSVAPVVYTVLPEIPSNQLRQKTIAVARIFYLILNLVNYILLPYMLNPENWAWGAKTGFFYLGTSLVCLVWSFCFVPETKWFTTAVLNWLFEQKVKARDFTRTQIPVDVLATFGESKP